MTTAWLLVDARLRKAAKPHACQECDNDIPKGEVYVAVEEPDFSATRYHLRCAGGLLVEGDDQPLWHKIGCPNRALQVGDPRTCECGGTPASFERVTLP